MKKNLAKFFIAALVLITIAVIFFTRSPEQKIVRDAYIYGYPLVTTDLV